MAKSAIKMQVEGLREMQDALAELPKRTSKAVLRRALIKGGKPIADAATANAPVLNNVLAPSINVTTKMPKGHNPGKAAFAKAMRSGAGVQAARSAARDANRVAPPAFAEAFVGPGRMPQAHMQEFGTETNPAQPYMRPAWDAQKGNALATVTRELVVEIKAAVERARRKALKVKR